MITVRAVRADLSQLDQDEYLYVEIDGEVLPVGSVRYNSGYECPVVVVDLS